MLQSSSKLHVYEEFYHAIALVSSAQMLASVCTYLDQVTISKMLAMRQQHTTFLRTCVGTEIVEEMLES